MSSPQLENGYIRIANELLEAIAHFDFSKRQYKVLLAVIRKTYGYGKKDDDMSITQLAQMTDLDPAHVGRTVRELVAMGVLLRRKGQYAHVIGLEKDYSRWGMAKTAIGGGQNSHSTMAKTAIKGWPKQPPQKTTPKDNSKRQPPPQMELLTRREINADKNPCGGGDFWVDCDLVYPASLSRTEQQAAAQMLGAVNGAAQSILDALEASIQAGQVKKSPLALLGGMIRRLQAGTFDPTPGLHIAEQRKRKEAAQRRMTAIDNDAVLRELEELKQLQNRTRGEL